MPIIFLVSAYVLVVLLVVTMMCPLMVMASPSPLVVKNLVDSFLVRLKLVEDYLSFR